MSLFLLRSFLTMIIQRSDKTVFDTGQGTTIHVLLFCEHAISTSMAGLENEASELVESILYDDCEDLL